MTLFRYATYNLINDNLPSAFNNTWEWEYESNFKSTNGLLRVKVWTKNDHNRTDQPYTYTLHPKDDVIMKQIIQQAFD